MKNILFYLFLFLFLFAYYLFYFYFYFYFYFCLGRTHQIRLHLKYLGFPIVNDPIYGFSKRKATQRENEINNKNEKETNMNNDEKTQTQSQKIPNSHDPDTFDSDCPICKKPYLDPEDEHLELWLHAYSYSTPSWHFKTELPGWALTSNKDIVDQFVFPKEK